MGKTCYKADDHRWGVGKTHLITADGLATRCGRALAVIPGELIEAASYDCKGCRKAKERELGIEAPRDAPPPDHPWRDAPLDRPSSVGTGSSFPMPFGKHRGLPVSDLDDGYLKWLRDKATLYGNLRAAIRDELEFRGMDTEALEDE